jgi:CRISPR/Cas system CSM-associated protein Csm3 (group 7 of RAMP superfamily)
MRDPSQYEEHGRTNPLSDEQRRQHPYDFVSLPLRPVKGSAVGHDRYLPGRLTGILTFTYQTVTPLHVGSGVFETAAQCGLSGGSQPVRGIVRRLGKPVLPGSSWKGAVRARFEAITQSRLGVSTRLAKVEPAKLPRVLRPLERGGKVKIEVLDGRLQNLEPADVRNPSQLANLSPADALFGAMGYRGRLHPVDGVITGPLLEHPLSVPPLESPAAHRLAKPGAVHRADHGVEISEVEGRKFYYDGPLLESRAKEGDDRRPVLEHIDAVPAGATITIDVLVESVTEAELGALLVCAGHGEGIGVVRLGGYKPAGLGKVRLTAVKGDLYRGLPTRGLRQAAPEPLDPEGAVKAAHREGLIAPSALAELHTITTRTRP